MKEPYTVYLGHTRTSTYITDLVETFTNIPKNFKPGEVYNIAGDDYHTIKEMPLRMGTDYYLCSVLLMVYIILNTMMFVLL